MPFGGSINLTCVAVGSPMPHVRWRLGNADIPTAAIASLAGAADTSGPAYSSASSSGAAGVGGGSSSSSLPPIGKNVLTLTDVRQTATYTCIAASELGNIEHDVEVRVKGELLPESVLVSLEVNCRWRETIPVD